MSSNAFTVPLTLNIKPSPLYRAALIALHGAIMGLSLVVLHERWVVALVFSLLLANMIYWLRLAAKPATLVVHESGFAYQPTVVSDAMALSAEWQLTQPAFVRTWMISLRLKQASSGQSKQVIVMPDAVSDDEFRRVSVLLGSGAGQAPESGV